MVTEFIAPGYSSMPGAGDPSTYGSLTNPYIAPGIIGSAPVPTGGGSVLANLTAEQLREAINQFNVRLRELEIPTMQNTYNIQNRGLDLQELARLQQAKQFADQLFLAEQTQRNENEKFWAQYGFNREQLRDLNIRTERQRQLDQYTSQAAVANQANAAMREEAMGRQGIAAGAYTAAEAARQAQQAHALNVANLVASLRGPSSAFKQMEVLGLLNQQGAAPLLGALAGEARLPMVRGDAATPEAATLATMARDAGGMVAPGNGRGGASAFTDSAAIQGLLALAAQNAPYYPTEPNGTKLSASYDNASTLAREAIAGTESVFGGGPSSTVSARLMKGFMQLLADRNGVAPAPNDPALLALYASVTDPPLSTVQARIASEYAHDYFKVYGVPMTTGQLDDMLLGQVQRGLPPDPAGWRPVTDPGYKGYGSEAAKGKTPPVPWDPSKDAQPGAAPPGIDPGTGKPKIPKPEVPGPGGVPLPPPLPPPAPGDVPTDPTTGRPLYPSPSRPPTVPVPVAPLPPAPAPGATPLPPAPPPSTNPGGAYDIPTDPATGRPLYPGPSTMPPPATPTAKAANAVTPKGWTSPEGYPAVNLADGRAGYRLPDGRVIDGSGAVIATGTTMAAVQTAAPAPALAPPAPATPAYVAPGPAPAPAPESGIAPADVAPGRLIPEPEQPKTTYTYDWLPGGKGLGYLGTDGKMFDSLWNPL